MPDITKRCVEPDCKKPFELPEKEQKFFNDKGWKLPRRCRECRARKRNESKSPFGTFARKKRYKDAYGT